jgi:hypothetical protein
MHRSGSGRSALRRRAAPPFRRVAGRRGVQARHGRRSERPPSDCASVSRTPEPSAESDDVRVGPGPEGSPVIGRPPARRSAERRRGPTDTSRQPSQTATILVAYPAPALEHLADKRASDHEAAGRRVGPGRRGCAMVGVSWTGTSDRRRCRRALPGRGAQVATAASLARVRCPVILGGHDLGKGWVDGPADDDDRNVAGEVMGPNRTARVQAVHDGHVNVEQHHVRSCVSAVGRRSRSRRHRRSWSTCSYIGGRRRARRVALVCDRIVRLRPVRVRLRDRRPARAAHRSRPRPR